MKTQLIILSLCLTGCNHSAILKPEDTKVSRSDAMQKEIDALLARDAENKNLEREYLEEIRKAQIHNDEDAFKFFLGEYAKVKRLNLPEWIKKEPGYQQAVDPEDILGEPLKIIIRLM